MKVFQAPSPVPERLGGVTCKNKLDVFGVRGPPRAIYQINRAPTVEPAR